ncbi:MAG TPA: hypothetical protein VKT82_11600 [Ktedonobacterales bacterium]|nr:hypothetical protein [Ktedonobacterales bacterium]
MSSTMQSQGMQQNIGSPISNEVYNVISVLHNKLEGLEAYRKYTQDGGNPQLWQYLSQADTQCVQYLMQELERIVQSGQHRLRQPGQVAQGQMGAQGPTAGTPIS